MKRLFKTKKRVALLVSIAALAAAAGAYAYFASTGSGSGSGSTATPAALTIEPIGAGYDSLIPSNTYGADQTYGGAGITDFGNAVTLASSANFQQLTTVVVAVRNWGPEINDPSVAASDVTLKLIINSGDGPVSATSNQVIPAAINGSTPSTANVTFNFIAQDYFTTPQLTFDLQIPQGGYGQSLNIALSDSSTSAHGVSVGTDTAPGTVLLANTGTLPSNNFPTCSGPGSATFGSVNVDCGSSVESGTYGNLNGVTSNADVPAVEINVIGGVVPDLSPGVTGVPVDFAILNPGSTAVQVSTVTSTITGNSKSGSGCNSGWYNLSPGGSSSAAVTLNANVPPGTTVFSPSGLSLNMPANATTDQSACEGASVALGFTSP